MANEAVLMNQDSDIHYFTWTAASVVTKGQILCVGTGDRTAKWHLAAADTFLGVAAHDYVAGETNGSIAVRTRGIMQFVAGGTVAPGDFVVLDATANRVVKAATATLSITTLGQLVGMSLDSGTTGTTIDVLVGGVR